MTIIYRIFNYRFIFHLSSIIITTFAFVKLHYVRFIGSDWMTSLMLPIDACVFVVCRSAKLIRESEQYMKDVMRVLEVSQTHSRCFINSFSGWSRVMRLPSWFSVVICCSPVHPLRKGRNFSHHVPPSLSLSNSISVHCHTALEQIYIHRLSYILKPEVNSMVLHMHF